MCIWRILGHTVTKDGLAPLPEKVAALQNYARPKTAKDLRRYLGIVIVACVSYFQARTIPFSLS